MAYGNDTDLQAYLDANGLTLPADAPSLAILRQRGSAYLDALYEGKLQCSSRTGGFSQMDAWPRTGHTVGGQTLPSDLIPQAWVIASYRAAWLEASNPGFASGAVDPTKGTKREKVDVIEVEYMTAKDTPGSSLNLIGNVDALINGIISGLLCSGRSFGFVVI